MHRNHKLKNTTDLKYLYASAFLFILLASLSNAHALQEIEESKKLSEVSKMVLKQFTDCENHSCNEQGFVDYFNETVEGIGIGIGSVKYSLNDQQKPKKVVFSGNTTEFGIFKITIFFRDDLNIKSVGLKDSIFGIIGKTLIKPKYEFHENGNLKKYDEYNSVTNQTTILEYSSEGNLKKKIQILSSGETKTEEYDSSRNITRETRTLPDGKTYTAYTDENGIRISEEILPDGTKNTAFTTKEGNSVIITTKIYSEEGKLIPANSTSGTVFSVRTEHLPNKDSIKSEEMTLTDSRKKVSASYNSMINNNTFYIKNETAEIQYTDKRKFHIKTEYDKIGETISGDKEWPKQTFTITHSNGTTEQKEHVNWTLWQSHNSVFEDKKNNFKN